MRSNRKRATRRRRWRRTTIRTEKSYSFEAAASLGFQLLHVIATSACNEYPQVLVLYFEYSGTTWEPRVPMSKQIAVAANLLVGLNHSCPCFGAK